MGSVFVTNTNAESFEDRYDGEPYVFPPKEQVLLPVDAAVHIFGYGLKDKTDTLVRLGKSMHYNPTTKTFTEDPDGARWLAAFIFEEAVMSPKSSLASALEAAS